MTGKPGGQYSSREDAGSDKLSRTSPGTALPAPAEDLVWCSVHGHLPAMSHSPKPTLPKGSAALGPLAPPSFEDTEMLHPRTYSRPLYAKKPITTSFSGGTELASFMSTREEGTSAEETPS